MISGTRRVRRDTRRKTSPPWLVCALAGLLLLVASGCKPTLSGVAPAASSEATVNDLTPILDKQARAVMHHDQSGFLADLDASNQRMMAQERMIFANLTQFQFSDYRFLTERTLYFDHPRDRPNAYVFAPVIAALQIAGTDAGPPGVAAAETFVYELTRKNSRWMVSELMPVNRAATARLDEQYPSIKKAGLNTPGFADAPWDLTPLAVVHAGDVWLAGDSSVPDLQQYAKAAQSEVGKVEALWGQRPRFPGYVLFFTSNQDNLRAWYDSGDRATRVEGVAVPQFGVRRTGEFFLDKYVGARIVVNLAKIALVGDDPGLVMRHELTHAVTFRDQATRQAPVWAVEGFARYVEGLESPQRAARQAAVVAMGVREGRFDGKPTGSQHFYDGDDFTVSFNYDLGASIFRWIEQIKGQGAAVEFYQRVNQRFDLPLIGTSIFEGICQQVLGMSTNDFLSQWRSYVMSLS